MDDPVLVAEWRLAADCRSEGPLQSRKVVHVDAGPEELERHGIYV
jgi:hypothetical protein